MIDTSVIHERLLARPTGLEPATTGSTVRYSNQLSYGPLKREFNRLIIVTDVGPASTALEMKSAKVVVE